jgi:hypothetical protein
MHPVAYRRTTNWANVCQCNCVLSYISAVYVINTVELMDMSMKFVITNHAVHNRLTFYPLSKNAMIKI